MNSSKGGGMTAMIPTRLAISATGVRKLYGDGADPSVNVLRDCERCRLSHVVRRGVILVELHHVAARLDGRRRCRVDVALALAERRSREGDVQHLGLAGADGHPSES